MKVKKKISLSIYSKAKVIPQQKVFEASKRVKSHMRSASSAYQYKAYHSVKQAGKIVLNA